jgi:hypothetical protein
VLVRPHPSLASTMAVCQIVATHSGLNTALGRREFFLRQLSENLVTGWQFLYWVAFAGCTLLLEACVNVSSW